VLDTETTPAQAWNAHSVAYVAGTFDSRLTTGEDYSSRTLAQVWAMSPASADKLAGPAFIPSSYADYDARSHQVQADKGSFVTLTADIDSGNHSPKAVHQAVASFVGDHAYMIYSSPHSRPSDRRWRVLVPLATPADFGTWFDAQTALFTYLGAKGIETDRALARPGQLVFLPNVPAVYVKTGEPLRDKDNKPLHFQRHATSLAKPGLDLSQGLIADGMAEIRRRREEDEREREKMRAEAAKRQANRPRGDDTSLIESFNASNTVPAMLEMCGYEQCPRNGDDWRSPHQTGLTYATRVLGGSTWYSLSQSDTDAGLGQRSTARTGGCFGDAYDLYVHFKHGGDHKAAYRQIGQEQRGNVIRPSRFNPPEWMSEVPMPEELPEGWDGDEIDMDFYGDEIAPELNPYAEPEAETLTVYDAFDYDEAQIPVRPWLIPGAILAGYTHMLAAPGGSGKSLFTLQLAMAMADGMEWGGFKPRKRYRSLIINVEDDIHEQRRRLSGARRVMATRHNLAGMVHIVDASESIVIARTGDRANSVVATPIVDTLRRYIADNQIDVIFVDPFAETFEGDENDNSQVKWAMRIWRDEIARATGCAVYLVHHTTKHAQNGAGDANVIRGAGAIVNSTRISATLMPMTPEDAQVIGIDPAERHLYVRFDDAKANQSLKTTTARWFRKESIELDNATSDCPADIVGALVPWCPPDAFDGLGSHTITVILDRLDAGMDSGERYTASTKGGSKASGRWAGCLLMETAGLSEGMAAKVVRTWIGTGVLIEDEYDCPVRRRKRSGVFAPVSARPGMPS
jgi:hypothetical protein